MNRLPKELTTVTPVSKALALFMFILFPIAGFFLGVDYQQALDISNQQLNEANVSIPRYPTPSPMQYPTTAQRKSCVTNSDCEQGSTCAVAGPLVYNPESRKTLSNRYCYKPGEVRPL